jgi:hypothetical protein
VLPRPDSAQGAATLEADGLGWAARGVSVTTVEFGHFRIGIDEGSARLEALRAEGWESAGAPRPAVDLSGRAVLVHRMRRFPSAVDHRASRIPKVA